MKKTFEHEKQEVQELNGAHKDYLKREFGNRDYNRYLSKPENHKKNIYYHNANSKEDKQKILKRGFDLEKNEKDYPLGKGLYLGRDKNALTKFYTQNVNRPEDFTITITGKFNFLDLTNEDKLRNVLSKAELFKKNIVDYTLALGFDGIRYYDPDATGEEFVLYNLKNK